MEAISEAISELGPARVRASRRQEVAAWACFATVCAACGFAIALVIAQPGAGSDTGFSILVAPIALASTGLGVLVRLRRPENLIGWLLLANGLVLAALALATPYAYYGEISHPGSLPGAEWATLWKEIDWPGLYVGLMAIAFVFPDGHLPSPRWRKVAIVTAIAYLGLELGFALHPGAFDPPFEDVGKPLPTYPSSLEWVWVPFYLGVLASLFAAVFAVRSRLRRATGPERLQVLWFTYAAMLIPLALLLCALSGFVVAEGPVTDVITGAVVWAMLVAILAAIAIGILRYRLFDIELVVNRTLVYGTLTVCIVVGYVAIVGALNALIDQRGVAGVLAAGLVAAGVQPLRLRLQRRADRWVYGDRSDPYAALTRLGERLQDTLAPGEVVQTVVDSVAEALRLRHAAIEFDREGSVEVVAAHGQEGTGERRRVPLVYNGERLGSLVVQVPPGRQLSAADERLLEDLAQHAGPAVHAVRLNADLQLSRERLVAAREEERRRLRRDLHDGLGPALAGMAMQLDAAKSRSSDPEIEAVLGELRAETQDAIADIRRVVYELRPPALDELGLVGALREQAARLSAGGDGLSVTVEAPDLPPLPAAVEVAAFRIATEALTNVSRHAGARRGLVELTLAGGLNVEVADDGRGFGSPSAGVGLTSMRERAAELGGALTVRERPGGGTLIRAELPVEAP
ncbi:MAG: GAF domain-containing sensor histidine kinase [Solirubrobacterales bacterium]